MKKVLLVASLVCLIAVSGFSQKSMNFYDPTCQFGKQLTPEFMQKFKASTMVFVIYNDEVQYTEIFRKMLEKVWTITPFKLVSVDEYPQYAKNEKYACCIRDREFITGIATTTGGSVQNTTNLVGSPNSASVEYRRLYYIYKYDRKGRPDSLALMAQKKLGSMTLKVYKKGQKEPYNTYVKNNLLTTYKLLQTLNKSLIKANLIEDPEKFIVDPSLGKLIINDTLYMLEYASCKRSSLWNTNYEDNIDVMKVYPYKYRFCSYDELYKIFITENRGRLFLDYDYSNVSDRLEIYDFKEGKCIYKQELNSPAHFCLTEKDLKKLLKKVAE